MSEASWTADQSGRGVRGGEPRAAWKVAVARHIRGGAMTVVMGSAAMVGDKESRSMAPGGPAGAKQGSTDG